jgi:hypothetical protein
MSNLLENRITIDKLPQFLAVFNHDAGKGDAGDRTLATFIISPPGFGKTTGVAMFSESIDAELFTVVASTLDRLDISGLPERTNDSRLGSVTEFAPMRLIAELSKERNPDGGKAVLYFNELNAAPESVLPVLYRLFNERAVCGLTLRDNVILVADGNPSSSASAGRDLQMALRRRFAWLVIEPSVPVWQKWALHNGIDARVISFFNAGDFAAHFCDFDPKKRDRLTYSCPASWTKLATGIVGMEAGTAFAAYLKHMDSLPDVNKVLANPDDCALPKKADILGLLCGSVVNHVVKHPEKTEGAIKLCIRLAESSEENIYSEFGAFLFRWLNQTSSALRARIAKLPISDKLIALVASDKEMMQALTAASAKVKKG